jgi:hypothetical protein
MTVMARAAQVRDSARYRHAGGGTEIFTEGRCSILS